MSALNKEHPHNVPDEVYRALDWLPKYTLMEIVWDFVRFSVGDSGEDESPETQHTRIDEIVERVRYATSNPRRETYANKVSKVYAGQARKP